jgi:hypothetical protein
VEQLAGGCIPQADHAILAAGGQGTAVWREDVASIPVNLSFQDIQQLATFHIPNADSIRAAYRQQVALWAEGGT